MVRRYSIYRLCLSLGSCPATRTAPYSSRSALYFRHVASSAAHTRALGATSKLRPNVTAISTGAVHKCVDSLAGSKCLASTFGVPELSVAHRRRPCAPAVWENTDKESKAPVPPCAMRLCVMLVYLFKHTHECFGAAYLMQKRTPHVALNTAVYAVQDTTSYVVQDTTCCAVHTGLLHSDETTTRRPSREHDPSSCVEMCVISLGESTSCYIMKT